MMTSIFSLVGATFSCHFPFFPFTPLCFLSLIVMGLHYWEYALLHGTLDLVCNDYHDNPNSSKVHETNWSFDDSIEAEHLEINNGQLDLKRFGVTDELSMRAAYHVHGKRLPAELGL